MSTNKASFWTNLLLSLIVLAVVYHLLGLTTHLDIGKRVYIARFTVFIAEVEDNYESMTWEEWEACDKRFWKFARIKYGRYKEHLSRDQLKMINYLKGEYKAIKMKFLAKRGMEKWEDLKDQISGFWNQISVGEKDEEMR